MKLRNLSGVQKRKDSSKYHCSEHEFVNDAAPNPIVQFSSVSFYIQHTRGIPSMLAPSQYPLISVPVIAGLILNFEGKDKGVDRKWSLECKASCRSRDAADVFPKYN
jgi:hypothetical protein